MKSPSDPPLSGSYSCLCQDARGCDVRSSGFAIDVAFALDELGFSLAGGDPLGVDMARQFHQPLGTTVELFVFKRGRGRVLSSGIVWRRLDACGARQIRRR